jgi:phage repressor protein C with HTH and peptisase S24 domain
MLNHSDLWRALDEMASRHGLTPSGLARKAGLDPTTFNPSKRVNASGRERWPSTESLAKAMDAVETTLEELFRLIERKQSHRRMGSVPTAAESDAAVSSAYDNVGVPCGPTWKYATLPNVADPMAYAIRIESNDYRPALAPGGLVVASPNAPISNGNRVVVRLHKDTIQLAVLLKSTAEEIDIGPFCGETMRHKLSTDEVTTLHRIVWVAQ